MAMAEEGMIEAEVKTTSPTPTNMVVGLTEGMEGTLSPPYLPHQGQTQPMLPGMHNMGICLLRTIPSSHNIKVSCNRQDNLAPLLAPPEMTSLQGLRIRLLMLGQLPTMLTCSMPTSNGWLVRLANLETGTTTVRETTTTPRAMGQAEAHQELPEDPSMVHQCLARITPPWGTVTTMAGTTGPLSLHLEEDSATVEMEALGGPSGTRALAIT